MSDMPSCAHLNVLYEQVDHDNGTCSDSWACRDCKHPFWPQGLAVAAHLQALRERNVGDSSKAARSEVVEKTADGSESAGLRERLATLAVFTLGRRKTEVVYVKREDMLAALEAVIPAHLSPKGETFHSKSQEKRIRAMRGESRTPAISRPPTQGALDKLFERIDRGYQPTSVAAWNEFVAELKSSLPPSRADLGGDRTDESK